MKNLHVAAAAMTISLFSNACANNKAAEKKFAGAPAVRSQDVAEAIIQQVPGKVLIQKMKDSSWISLWKTVIRISSNKAFNIDGLNFDGVKSAAYQLESEVEYLDNQFGTLGEYIDQTDLYLPPNTTAASFKEAMVKTHEYFSGEGEWRPVKSAFESNTFQDLLDPNGFSGSFGEKKDSSLSDNLQNAAAEAQEAAKALCGSDLWKTGRDPAVLGNIAACARGLTSKAGDPNGGAVTSATFGVDTQRYLNDACSALFVLVVASATAGLGAEENCDSGF